MTIFLVRHASAGQRPQWANLMDNASPDLLRPLDQTGLMQADRLAGFLTARPVKRVLSSPALRCTQTVAPVAATLLLEVETDEALLEGADVGRTMALIEQCADEADDSVLCSHGDVIPDVLRLLQLRGMTTLGRGCAKGSVWSIDHAGGRFMSATYTPVKP